MRRIIQSILVFCLVWSCASVNNIHEAVKMEKFQEVESYVDRGDIEKKDVNGFTPLLVAAYYGHRSMVEYLCNKRANVDKSDNKGWTSLMYASLYNWDHIVKILIDHNASVNLKNSEGHTALYYAEEEEKNYAKEEEARLKNQRIIKLLKENGAKAY